MFSTQKLFGFCAGEGIAEVFFHAQDFYRTVPGEPPPIVGERVTIPMLLPTAKNRLRAQEVHRIQPPEQLFGKVVSYDPRQGWGFVSLGTEAVFLHASDIVPGWVPVAGASVSFYRGLKEGNPRACWLTPTR